MRKFLALLLLLLLCACGATPVEQNEPCFSGYCGEVMLYTSMQERQIQAIQKGFQEKYPGITLNYYFGSSGKLLTKILSEFQSGEVKADLIWTGNPADYIKMKEDRVLSPYLSPQAINIDSQFADPQHYFIGGRLSSSVIAYNEDLISPEELPKSWEDLLDPKWQGQLLMADPYSAGNSAYFVGALMNSPQYGPNFFESLKKNGCMLESGTTTTHLRVAQGEYPLCIGLDYVSANLRAEGYPINAIYPDGDLIAFASPIGLVAGGPSERNARLLYDFILSPEGQEILVENGLHSIRQDVKQPEPSVQSILDRRLPTDDAEIAKNSNKVLSSFDKIFF